MDNLVYEVRPWIFAAIGIYAVTQTSAVKGAGTLMLISGTLLYGAASVILWVRFKHRLMTQRR